MKLPPLLTPLLLLIPALAPAQENKPTKRNVLLIAVDDLKPNIGAYGDPVAKTPNIDRLAARGLLFQHAYTNQALCSPSRNALLAGLKPTTLGIYELSTNFRKSAPDAITLPQHFKANGYRAEAAGKLYHIGRGNTDDAASWSVPHFRPGGAGYALEENRPPEDAKKTRNGSVPRGAATESADVPDETYADGLVAKEIVKRLEAAKERPDTPFFIAAGFHKPHLPFVSPKKYWDLYDPSTLKLPELRTAPGDSPAVAFRKNSELAGYKDTRDADNLSDEKQIHLLHGYYAAVSYTDAQIGKILDALDRLGLTENTVIVLWGDHGWHLGDHGLWAKMTNFEQANRIPLLISAPGVTQGGSQTAALAQSIDVYPTLVELAGLPAPETNPGIDGKSLVPVLKDPAAVVNEEVLHVIPRAGGIIGRALRTPTHRVVQWKKPGASPDTAEWELYDYVNDPTETKNQADSQPEVLAALKEKINALPEPKEQIPVVQEPAPAKKPAPAKADPPAPAAEQKPEEAKDQPATEEAPKKKINRAKLFRNRDKDQDGKLSSEEFLNKQPDPDKAPARFKRFDKDGDGFLSEEEFVAGGRRK